MRYGTKWTNGLPNPVFEKKEFATGRAILYGRLENFEIM